ncbi:hypothetical protein QA600_21695 [Natronococcus sp. A-GB1]|uniref:hypothetical protein n=1 Tax=Natronococcus TaxID=29287 RepID=UPI0024202E58|nr:hypothetical protein [Natronococcus sp. A-GB1]MDG5761939.1 hypothetical protein [Natronococcus sp. A-GB1]
MALTIEIRGADKPTEEARIVAGYERGQQLSQLLEAGDDVDPKIADELKRYLVCTPVPA